MGKAKKWSTLTHKGPVFAPPYKPLGKDLLRYGGKSVHLSPRSEEWAVAYAKHLIRQKKPSALFQKNFFHDWKSRYMTKKEKSTIKCLSKCTFGPLVTHLKRLASARKQLSPAQKAREKRKREELKKIHGTVKINGKAELLSSYQVEPPCLYIGRGNNPNSGKIKDRIRPEDVTINCSRGARIPPPPGHKWKGYEHNQSAAYVAKFRDPLTGRMKFIYPHASSKLISCSTKTKFNKAAELGKKINSILARNTARLSSSSTETRQVATAVYLLNHLAIRIGQERESGESDTVGCTTLRKEHVAFKTGNKITFEFEGKDCVPYKETVRVSRPVYCNLKSFVRGKTDDSFIFDLITSTKVNFYLGSLMDGLTAKVFRTYKATECYKKSFRKFMSNVSKKDNVIAKRFVHAKANLAVAKLLNHQVMAQNTLASRKRACEACGESILKMKRRRLSLTQHQATNNNSDLQERIEAKTCELKIKKDGIKWAPNTSLVNYIDPREVKKLCSKIKLPIDKVYSAAQREKFKWAIGN